MRSSQAAFRNMPARDGRCGRPHTRRAVTHAGPAPGTVPATADARRPGRAGRDGCGRLRDGPRTAGSAPLRPAPWSGSVRPAASRTAPGPVRCRPPAQSTALRHRIPPCLPCAGAHGTPPVPGTVQAGSPPPSAASCSAPSHSVPSAAGPSAAGQAVNRAEGGR